MTIEAQNKARKLSAMEKLSQEIAELRERTHLDGWNGLLVAIEVPADILPAIMANRPELMAAAQPRAMEAPEVAKLYRVIEVLLDTNQALREHTARVAQLTNNLNGQLVGFARVAQQIERFANFEVATMEDDED